MKCSQRRHNDSMLNNASLHIFLTNQTTIFQALLNCVDKYLSLMKLCSSKKFTPLTLPTKLQNQIQAYVASWSIHQLSVTGICNACVQLQQMTVTCGILQI